MVCLLLELSTFLSLGFDHSLDLIKFTLPLLDGVTSFTHFVPQIIIGRLLQVILALGVFELVCQSLYDNVGSFVSVLCQVTHLDMMLLIASKSQLKLKQLLSLLRVELLTLLEVCNLNHQLLLVHLALHVVQIQKPYVIDVLNPRVHLVHCYNLSHQLFNS